MQNLEIIIVLLTITTFLAVVADKTRFPFPILLILVGMLFSQVPWIPQISLAPELVFFIFLPPLLHFSAWGVPWADFKANLRPIGLAGVGLVFFTTALVAWAAHQWVPGLGWPEAFVLGAIVSPPDAVAAAAATEGLGLHKRIRVILEGESLVNDASGLIAYKYAVAAVVTGAFSLWQATGQFLVVASGGVAIGLSLGYLVAWVYRNWTEEPKVETVLSFLTPYFAYLIAENLHVSGVLAVVSCGLFLAVKAPQTNSALSRLQGRAVWETVNFILNSLVFLLIGLQLKHIVADLDTTYSLSQLWGYGLLVSLATIVVRFLWVYPAAYLPRLLSRRIREREYFRHGNVVVFGWAGMRGVVSMAAAFALPLTIVGGQAFPNRALITFLTFCVVFVTLTLQGLTLPWLIKLLRLEPYSSAKEEVQARLALITSSINYIEENLSYGRMSDQVLGQLKTKYEIKINRLRAIHNQEVPDGLNSPIDVFNQFVQMQVELLEVERGFLRDMRKARQIDEEVMRKLEHELDLEEARLLTAKQQA
ncbi:MAG: Na+/H+ antiporter [Bernardetiaceae bacterium]|jgi:CPA1 family monovalent cation:H+ antiporter|nr:Na+/H+ antiporter [Bernardetiaceae bacterium]